MKFLDGYLAENQHNTWSSLRNPVITVSPEELIRVRIPDSSTLQITRRSHAEDLAHVDHSKLDTAVGPIFVEGASPGDVLEVSIHSIEAEAWGWTTVSSDFGLLKNRFRERLILWDIRNGSATTTGDFLHGISIPVSPFLGIVGLAPERGEFGMIPPQIFGGNMDNRLLGPGSRVYLPVKVEGGLLSLADPHAAQGDGEVCGTAIETPAEAVISIKVIKGTEIGGPRAYSIDRGLGEVIVTMGIDHDLHMATVTAVESMMAELAEYGFTDEEGYVLCSIAGSLRISEVVDEPNFVVSMLIPKDLARQGKFRIRK